MKIFRVIRDSVLLSSGRISRRPVDTLICKRVNRSPRPRVSYMLLIARSPSTVKCAERLLLNDYINGSRIPRARLRTRSRALITTRYAIELVCRTRSRVGPPDNGVRVTAPRCAVVWQDKKNIVDLYRPIYNFPRPYCVPYDAELSFLRTENRSACISRGYIYLVAAFTRHWTRLTLSHEHLDGRFNNRRVFQRNNVAIAHGTICSFREIFIIGCSRLSLFQSSCKSDIAFMHVERAR